MPESVNRMPHQWRSVHKLNALGVLAKSCATAGRKDQKNDGILGDSTAKVKATVIEDLLAGQPRSGTELMRCRYG